MNWAERMLDLALSGVALALDTDLAHVKHAAGARLQEHNPLRSIAANHDLVRALRLAWVQAALDLLEHARRRCDEPEWHRERDELRRFTDVARPTLRAVRSAAFNRAADPGVSPIDASLQMVIAGTAEAPGGRNGPGQEGDPLTDGFGATLAALIGWPVQELPDQLLRSAREGLALPVQGGAEPGPRRRFGELVFAEFAELIKDPDRYPQAGAAFGIAMHQAMGALLRQTLEAVRGVDERLDQALPQLDGLRALQDGLTAQADRTEQIRQEVGLVPQATVELLMQRLRPAAADSGIERRTLIALAQRLTPDEVRDVDQAVKELEHAVELATQVMAQQAEAPASDAFVSGVLADVARHTREGELDGACGSLEDAMLALEREEAQQREQMRRSRRTLLEAGVRQEMLRRDAFAAAQRLEALCRLDQAEPAATDDLLERARAHLAEGGTQGLNLPLQVALEIGRRLAGRTGDDGLRRAALDLQASALELLGERVADSAALAGAVGIRRELLAGLDAADAAWAAAQGALGAALNRLGWRLYDVAMLHESIEAHRAEVQGRSREQDPDGWAAAQRRLGRALYTLGFREGDQGLLERAVQAFDAALQVQSRARDGEAWASTQHHKGVALSMLARHTGQVAWSRQAIEAYRQALKERPRSQRPAHWAACTNDLALELMALGGATDDLPSLDAAIEALRGVAEVRDRSQDPMDWAITHHNLGGALTGKATLVQGDAGLHEGALEQAVEAFRRALQEFDRERTPVFWTASQSDLSSALVKLALARRSPELAHDGVRAAQAALSRRDRQAAPLEWANSQLALAQALQAQADLADSADVAGQAREAYRAALEEFTEARRPAEQREAQDGLRTLDARWR